MNGIDYIGCDLDFDRDGKQFGNIRLKFSNNEHAFDTIPVPIVTIKNGNGPTLLLSAGNHGDEYEGQVIIRRLIHELEADDINGRLILLPALNYPAMLANQRISPLDQGNMNRSFPGIEEGPPTAAIADYVTRQLLPLSDAGIDLHSGGSAAYYLPCAFLCTAADPDITRRNLALVDAFGAPVTFVVLGENSSSGFDPIAHRAGVPFISTELSGGANVDIAATKIGMRGVQNVMRQLGLIDGEIETQTETTLHERHRRQLPGQRSLQRHLRTLSGNSGDQVAAGDIAGRLYSAEEVEREPLELTFDRPGTILVRRNGARVRRGSHLFMVASEMTRDDVLGMI